MKKYPSIVSNNLIAIFPTPFPLDYSCLILFQTVLG